MNTFSNKRVIVLILTIGTFIEIVKGAEARQKWEFKIKNRYAEKRQLAEKKKLLRSGAVPLDDIEISSFHK